MAAKDPREIAGDSLIIASDEAYVIFGLKWIVSLRKTSGEIIWKRSVRCAAGRINSPTVISNKAIIAVEFMTDKLPEKKWTSADK